METSLELYHHGVKGQHWGSRNGPPYPLYRKSAYYKKTGQRPPGYTGNKNGKSDSGGTNKSGRVGGLKDIKRAGDTSWVRKRTLRNLTGGRIGGIDDSKSEKRKQLAKKIAIGAGTAAALAGAGYLAYRNRAAIGSKAGKLRDDIRFKLGELPGTAKLNQTRVDLKNKILGVGKKAKGLANEARTPTSALRNDIRLIGTSAKGMVKNAGSKVKGAASSARTSVSKNANKAYNTYLREAGKARRSASKAKDYIKNKLYNNSLRTKATSMRNNIAISADEARRGIKSSIDKNKNKLYNTYLREAGKVRRSASNAKDYVKRTYNNKIRTAPGKAKELLSKPGSKVYERIAGESKRAAQAANYDLSVNSKRKQALEKFIQENPKAIENATIAKRKVLANIRRGDYVKSGDTLRNLNAKANKLAAKERDLVVKGNEAKRLLGELNSQTKLGAERYNAAMATFNKRNRLGKIAAGATNAGIGLGLAGAAGGAGYGISRLARKRRSRKRRRR